MMTYKEIKNKLNKCELALYKIQNNPNGKYPDNIMKEKTAKLKVLKEELNKKLKTLSEQDKGVVSTDDPKDAEDLAKKGLNVKLTNEQDGVEFSIEETKLVAKDVAKALLEALREVGDEVHKGKVRNIEPNSFEVYIEYKNEFTDEFSFYIDQDTLHLVDFSFDKEIGEIGIKPSGVPIVHDDLIQNNLIKHFKSLNEQDSKREKYIHLFNMFKKAPEEKKRELKPKLEKAAKQLGMDLDLTGISGSRKSKKRFGRMSEDLEIGHRDDEPGMLKRYAYDTATYAAKLYKLLDKYDRMEDKVDFPNWWQEKVMRARQDISKAQHYLEFEEKQPVIDQLALENKQIKELKSFEESGLMIKGRTRDDNQKIDDIIEDLGLYAEWNAREGYFFLPEEEDLFDGLEKMIQKEFDKKDVNAYFEGVFENVIREEFKPSIGKGSVYALEVKKSYKTVILTQDNGQKVVVSKEDIPKLIQNLKDTK